MNTLLWILIEWINPVIVWCYPGCDWILGWTIKMGPVWGIVGLGVFTGLTVNLFQKYASDQNLLGKCKADLNKLKKFMAEGKTAGDKEKIARLMNVSKRVSGKYMWGSLKPSLLTVPPVILIAMWAGSRLGFMPVKPGETIEVIACFENEARGFAHVISSSEDLEIVGPAITKIDKGGETEIQKKKREALAVKGVSYRWKKPWLWFIEPTEEEKRLYLEDSKPPPLGLECHWKVRPRKPGAYVLTFRYPTAEGYQSLKVDFPVPQTAGQPPEFITFVLFDTPTLDHLQSIQFDIADGMPLAWWNLCLQWMGLYINVAVLGCVVFRSLFRIN